MPKYKNGKVVHSRIKVQGLIRSKCHLDFHRKIISTRGYLEKLVTLKNLLKDSSVNVNGGCKENEVLNS
jgi:hypothetical protein